MKEDKYLKKLTDQSKKEIFLTQDEKGMMKSQMLDFMKRYPMRPEKIWSFGYIFQYNHIKYASSFAVLIFVVMFGVSYAANNASPGDILYQIKVGVNEKVLGLLQVSDEAKAEYEVELAQLRLEEIERISAKEIVDDEVKENVNFLLDKHIEKIKEHSAKIESKNNPELSLKINSELEASFNAHKEILHEISEKNNTLSPQKAKAELLDIDNRFNKVKKQRQESEQAFSSKNSSQIKEVAEGKIRSAEDKIEDVEKFIESKKEYLSEESFETAKINLELAKSTIEKGKKSMESGNYQEAFLIFQKAISIAQQAQISVQASVDLEINVFEVKDLNGNNHDTDEQEKQDDEEGYEEEGFQIDAGLPF